MKITKEQFLKKYELHQDWLKDNAKGERLVWNFKIDFRFEFSFSADLSYADLRSADLSSADLSYADLRSADLSYADLSYADLRSADLRSADLDFSSGISFHCNSKGFKAGIRLAAQLAMHFCWIDFGDCEEAKEAQKHLKNLANKMHRIQSGELEEIK